MCESLSKVLTIVVALMLIPVAASGAASASQFQPPGRLIAIGGQRLHIHSTGSGSPTVVIDGGAGTWSIYYSHVQDAKVYSKARRKFRVATSEAYRSSS